MADYEIVRQTETPTVGIRRVVPMNEMQNFFSDAYERLFHEIGEKGLTVTGPPYGRYRGEPSDTFDVEAGVPIAQPTTSHDDIVAGHLPAVEAVQFVHIGPYDTLRQSYESIAAWMAQNDIVPGAEMWEQYLSDPMAEPDPSKWETKIVWPVVR